MGWDDIFKHARKAKSVDVPKCDNSFQENTFQNKSGRITCPQCKSINIISARYYDRLQCLNCGKIFSR